MNRFTYVYHKNKYNFLLRYTNVLYISDHQFGTSNVIFKKKKAIICNSEHIRGDFRKMYKMQMRDLSSCLIVFSTKALLGGLSFNSSIPPLKTLITLLAEDYKSPGIKSHTKAVGLVAGNQVYI